METTLSRMGETWDMVARRVYGDEHFMDALIAANVKLRDTVIFSYGVEIVTPEIDTRSTAYDINLPPWKRK
ncbi:tail protein X [Mailhella massiliensis]|uniref:tail protein X n=1 Tax=Mailhella massiliensis TaxID=1903261 RepID=UPI00097D8C6E|nr:tail protein X [Mailhella massiliensis]